MKLLKILGHTTEALKIYYDSEMTSTKIGPTVSEVQQKIKMENLHWKNETFNRSINKKGFTKQQYDQLLFNMKPHFLIIYGTMLPYKNK